MATDNQSSHRVKQGIISIWFSRVVIVVFWLLLSLFFSIVIEWILINTSHKEEGVRHSQVMLETELGYLNEDFKRSLLTSSPVVFASNLIDSTHRSLFVKTGIKKGMIKLVKKRKVHPIARTIAKHVLVAINVTKVFVCRLAVLFLALPVFFIFGTVAIVQGLVQRDIRRWGFGRERAGMYHHAKRATPILLIAPWFVYLSLPQSVHPDLVILPFAGLFALGLYFMTYLYKKHI